MLTDVTPDWQPDISGTIQWVLNGLYFQQLKLVKKHICWMMMMMIMMLMISGSILLCGDIFVSFL